MHLSWVVFAKRVWANFHEVDGDACAGHVSGAARVGVQQFRVYATDRASAVAIQPEFDGRLRPGRRQCPSAAAAATPTTGAADSISGGSRVSLCHRRLRPVPYSAIDHRFRRH